MAKRSPGPQFSALAGSSHHGWRVLSTKARVCFCVIVNGLNAILPCSSFPDVQAVCQAVQAGEQVVWVSTAVGSASSVPDYPEHTFQTKVAGALVTFYVLPGHKP